MKHEFFQLRYDGEWESGWHCWTDLITGSSFSTLSKCAKEVLPALEEIRARFDREEAA